MKSCRYLPSIAFFTLRSAMYVNCVGAIVEAQRAVITEVLLVSLLINLYAVAVVVVVMMSIMC
jgi:hypothetical protein